MNFFSQVTKQHRGGYRGGGFCPRSTPWDLERKVPKGKKIENHDI